MENLGKRLYEKIKELSDIEVQEMELQFAIFNSKAIANYEEKIELINNNFIEQSNYYGKKIEDFENEKNEIISRYSEEFQKIYDTRKDQFINIINEIQEMQSNQKIALANIESLYNNWDSVLNSEEYEDYVTKKQKYEYIINISKNNEDIQKYTDSLKKLKNPIDLINIKMAAVVDKYEKYDGVIFECEKKIEDCIKALEDDFNSIMKYRNNSLVVPKKENFIVRLLNKLFGGNKKFTREVIDKMNDEIDDIQKNDLKLLEIINDQTINLVAKIEELRQQINSEYKVAVE